MYTLLNQMKDIHVNTRDTPVPSINNFFTPRFDDYNVNAIASQYQVPYVPYIIPTSQYVVPKSSHNAFSNAKNIPSGIANFDKTGIKEYYTIYNL